MQILAFYNDHHFHQGYHIYAAATVAYFDNEWGKRMFENVRQVEFKHCITSIKDYRGFSGPSWETCLYVPYAEQTT